MYCVLCACIAICMYWYGFVCNWCSHLHSHLMCSAFYSLCYSADCSCLLAAGRSKFICIYSCQHQVLLKKFLITRNRSFDGMRVCCRPITHRSTCPCVHCPFVWSPSSEIPQQCFVHRSWSSRDGFRGWG